MLGDGGRYRAEHSGRFRMSLLKYTMPANLPCYTGWDFPVYPGTFLFYMDAMIDTFRRTIAHGSK